MQFQSIPPVSGGNDQRDGGTHSGIVHTRSTDTDAEVEDRQRVVVTTGRHRTLVDFVRGVLDLGGGMVLWFLDVNGSAGVLRVGSCSESDLYHRMSEERGTRNEVRTLMSPWRVNASPSASKQISISSSVPPILPAGH